MCEWGATTDSAAYRASDLIVAGFSVLPFVFKYWFLSEPLCFMVSSRVFAPFERTRTQQNGHLAEKKHKLSRLA